jgi:hypothetical protein
MSAAEILVIAVTAVSVLILVVMVIYLEDRGRRD